MKLTYEQKLLVIEDYFKIGPSSTANKWGLNRNYVRELVRLLQNNSLQAHGKKIYIHQISKLKLLKHMLMEKDHYVNYQLNLEYRAIR